MSDIAGRLSGKTVKILRLIADGWMYSQIVGSNEHKNRENADRATRWLVVWPLLGRRCTIRKDERSSRS